MKTEPVTQLVKQSADRQFRSGIFPPNLGHNCAAFGWGEYVGHGTVRFYCGVSDSAFSNALR
jgi:hypothetical protein